MHEASPNRVSPVPMGKIDPEAVLFPGETTMDGKELEKFVARLEQALLPAGFSVSLRDRRFNAAGVQIAEFDIVATGFLGSSKVTCLIECRDRPSEGAAPASWIEQLVGRRERFGFDKVLAVSTTGFAPGAIDYAANSRIDLRIVNSLTPLDIAHWFLPESLTVIRQETRLEDVRFVIPDFEEPARIAAFQSTLPGKGGESLFLRSQVGGEAVSPATAFHAVVQSRGDLWPTEPVDGWSRSVQITVDYPVGDRYEVVTAVGNIEIPQIVFTGVLRVTFNAVPVAIAGYSDVADDKDIAQSASVEVPMADGPLILSFDKMGVDGETKVSIRKK